MGLIYELYARVKQADADSHNAARQTMIAAARANISEDPTTRVADACAALSQARNWLEAAANAYAAASELRRAAKLNAEAYEAASASRREAKLNAEDASKTGGS